MEKAVMGYTRTIFWNLPRTENNKNFRISARDRWSRFELGTSRKRRVTPEQFPIKLPVSTNKAEWGKTEMRIGYWWERGHWKTKT
jgi:hypothetical protein